VSAPGLLIGAIRSGSGKTTLTLGLMRALARRGLRIGAAKCGPDYIDPAFHAAATGGDSFNLDSWCMAPPLIEALAMRAGAGADMIIAEGAMGLFDGAPQGASGIGASADVAALTGWPLLLLHDVSGQGQSAAAVVRGVAAHDPRVAFAGVVLNRVASPRHEFLARGAIEALGVKVFGALPREGSVILPERHLGLVQAGETQDLRARLDALAHFIEAHVNVAALIAAAGGGALPGAEAPALAPPGGRIALARDEAFSFFYAHHAALWRAAGAEISFFSPLADEPPPDDCDFCWLPGGYPELNAGRLAASGRFLAGLRRFSETRPVHGECGGYMVLGETLVDAQGAAHAMAGLLALETSFATRKLHLGYRRAELLESSPLGPAGALLRGHEFHYATIRREEGAPFALARDAYGEAAKPAGLRRGRVSGSFFHLVA
jgi:cobyrinic acid a,c-diamide synthase